MLCAYRMPVFDTFSTLAVLGASGVGGPFIVVSGESGDGTPFAAIHAGAADFVGRGHVGCLGMLVGRCLRLQRAARPTRPQADAAANESRKRFQGSIKPLIDPFVSLRPLPDQADRIAGFIYDYANGVACLANIRAGEDLLGMHVLDQASTTAAST